MKNSWKGIKPTIISLQKSKNESSKITSFVDQTVTDPRITAKIQLEVPFS